MPSILTTAAPAAPAANAGWEEVGVGSASGGGISNNSGSSSIPSIAIAPGNTPYVAWMDWSDLDREIYVRRWNGSSWEEVGAGSATGGGISNNSDDSMVPSIAIAPGGTPYVTWYNYVGYQNSDVFVLRWNGGSWEEVGAGSATGGGISKNTGFSGSSSIAIALNGTPYVAWGDEASGNREIYVRRWNGSSWEEVGAGSASGGGISNNSGASEMPSVAIASNDTPYIVWRDDTSGDLEIYVRRWNGTSWEEVGAGSATGGGISNNSGTSAEPSVAITLNSVPYVAWYDNSGGDYEIYVRRWNGSAWEEVGAGSATGGGISNNSGASAEASVAIASDGVPYVTWTDTSSGGSEIYVRRWNGSAWEEAGAGSATGGGISDGDYPSYSPSIATAPDGTPVVAWSYNPNYPASNEIYVRRRIEPPALQVFPTALLFLAEAGGADPLPRTVSISSTVRSITWTATISPAVDWLQVAPLSGTTRSLITATATISGLITGQYTTTLIVDGGMDVINSPQMIPVKLIVADEIYSTFLPLVLRGY